MDKTENALRNRGYCEVAVERAHTKSLDAIDKLTQTRSHVRDTTASRKRQVRMRKVKSTIPSSIITCSLSPLVVTNFRMRGQTKPFIKSH